MSISGYLRRSTGLPIGTAMLLVALIGWGLQYKTSLYQERYLHSPSPSPAKLLSDAERGVTSKVVLGSHNSTPLAKIAKFRAPAASYQGEPLRDEGFVQFALHAVPPEYRAFRRFSLRAPPRS